MTVAVLSERPRRTAEVLAPGVVSLHLDGWTPGRGANARGSTRERITRPGATRREIGTYLTALPKPTPPVFVLSVFESPSTRDEDNLAIAPKHLYDAVRQWLGVDDAPGGVWSALARQLYAPRLATHLYVMERRVLAPIDDAWWPVSAHAGWQYAALAGVPWADAMERLRDLGDLDMHHDVPQRDGRYAATRDDAPGYVFRVTEDTAWPPRPLWIESVSRGEVTDLARVTKTSTP